MFGVLLAAGETALMLVEPTYRCYKTLTDETGAATNDDAHRVLLVHWVAYGVFRAVDILVESWCPMYGVAKLAAIVWLRAAGSEQLYRSAIEPFFDHCGPTVDPWLHQYREVVDHVMNTVTAFTADLYVSADEDRVTVGDDDVSAKDGAVENNSIAVKDEGDTDDDDTDDDGGVTDSVDIGADA